MNVFEFRQTLVNECAQFTRNFTRIKTDDTHNFVDLEYASQKYWPEPLIQVNPNFQPGGTVESLCETGPPSPKCAEIFRFGKTASSAGQTLPLYKHPVEAISLASAGESYVLTTGTCPMFRSQRDAEVTKKLYRAAPVLIREAQVDGEGKEAREVAPEVKPWGISFSQDMTSASDLFMNGPAQGSEHCRRPLYEAKLTHQFDHHWATFIPDPAIDNDDWSSRDVTPSEKTDPSYQVATRYWVDEREVLARKT